MWNIVFVQGICINDKIKTWTKYSTLKKSNMTNLLEKIMTIYLINNFFKVIQSCHNLIIFICDISNSYFRCCLWRYYCGNWSMITEVCYKSIAHYIKILYLFKLNLVSYKWSIFRQLGNWVVYLSAGFHLSIISVTCDVIFCCYWNVRSYFF